VRSHADARHAISAASTALPARFPRTSRDIDREFAMPAEQGRVL
jgi:hypothetical protein